MNSKGQAFSVFELLIAAVVAVAILFVLLPIIVPPEPPNQVVNAISSAIQPSGGDSMSIQFTMDAKQMVTGKSIASAKNIDAHSILFDAGDFSSDDFESDFGGSDNAWAYIQSKKGTATNVKAKVVCEITGNSLNETLASADITISLNPIDICGEEEYQPCCVVILKRP